MHGLRHDCSVQAPNPLANGAGQALFADDVAAPRAPRLDRVEGVQELAGCCRCGTVRSTKVFNMTKEWRLPR